MDESTLSHIAKEAARTQVLVFAGGMGRRMGAGLPKALYTLDGKTLIDRCVSLFANSGYADFVFLLGHGHQDIQKYLSTVHTNDIRTLFSVDPAEEYGRGRSLLHALKNGRVDPSRRSVVVFPDDVFTDEQTPIRVLSEHMYGVKSQNASASLVLTQGRYWPYGVADVDEKGMVTSFTEKPFIKQPTSVGNYIFEPPVYGMLEDSPEIERELIPRLATAKKLYAIFIPSQSWLPINTLKDFDEAEKALSGAKTM
ncbi:MAG: NTP transferase domain-containing protein [Nitrososphaerota archaeon]|nr:NTP transferase domain-containing protein [Nitrososphaerota archaeon]